MTTKLLKTGSTSKSSKISLHEIENLSSYDVIIIGAGSAGIGAARFLQKHNKTLELKQQSNKINFLVLEARQRVGGRCYSSGFEGVHIDWGGKWIHGSCKKNPMRKLMNDLRRENGDDLPVDVPKWFRSGKVENIAIKSKNLKTHAKYNSTTKPGCSNESKNNFDSSSVLTCLARSSKNESNLGYNWCADLAEAGMEVFKGDSWFEGSLQGRIMKVIARTMRKEMDRIISDVKSNVSKQVEDYDFTIEEALDKFLANSDELKKYGDSQPRGTNNEAVKSHVPKTYLNLLQHVLQRYGETIGCNKSDIASKKYTSSPYLEMIIGLFSIRIYHEFENFEGQRLDVVSSFHGETDGHLPGGNTDVRPGYGNLLELAANSLFEEDKIVLGGKVSEIGILPDNNNFFRLQVTETLPSNGKEKRQQFNITLRCKHVICTLPLGCLQDAVNNSFNPNNKEIGKPLKFTENFFPLDVVKAIQRLGVAVMDKVALSFEKKWWPDSLSILNMISGKESHPTWHVWPSFHVESFLDPESENNEIRSGNVLLCYLTGAFAESIESKSDDEVMQNCMQFLRRSFKQDERGLPSPIAFKMTRWKNDQFSRGSWTILPKNADLGDISVLRKPILVGKSCTFHFAGEHTCDGKYSPALENGTVHGAWLSGELAVKEVITKLSSQKTITLNKDTEFIDSDIDTSEDSDSETFSSSDS